MEIPNRTWNQEHYDQAKEIIPDDVEFHGPGNFRGASLLFDLGNVRPIDEVQDVADRTALAFERNGVRVHEKYVTAQYRGAMDNALMLEIKFEE